MVLKTLTISKLKSKVWKEFSRYIRVRDSVNGYCYCYTCNNPHPIGESDAGHYFHGNTKPTYFDERNVHAQCTSCNRNRSGNLAPYAVHLEKDYGFGIIQELEIKSKGKVYNRAELENLLITYKQKVKDIIL